MRDEALFIDDILQATSNLHEFVSGQTLSEFLADNKSKYAVLKRLEDIGEAAKHLSQATCDNIASVDWKRVKAFRDIAVHEYFAINWKIVWEAATADAPALAKAVRAFVEQRK